jgi:hypothetical protein
VDKDTAELLEKWLKDIMDTEMPDLPYMMGPTQWTVGTTATFIDKEGNKKEVYVDASPEKYMILSVIDGELRPVMTTGGLGLGGPF